MRYFARWFGAWIDNSHSMRVSVRAQHGAKKNSRETPESHDLRVAGPFRVPEVKC